VAAHQSHRRLSVGRRFPPRSGWIPPTTLFRRDDASCRITFLVCPLSVNPAPVLWRDPKWVRWVAHTPFIKTGNRIFVARGEGQQPIQPIEGIRSIAAQVKLVRLIGCAVVLPPPKRGAGAGQVSPLSASTNHSGGQPGAEEGERTGLRNRGGHEFGHQPYRVENSGRVIDAI
jgi:hypothetical protein